MIHEIQAGYVKVETHNAVTTIEFYHPQGNSLPAKILADLAQEFHSVANEDDTRVVILRSAGEKAFCSGASFDELTLINSREQGLDFFSGFAHVINAMRKCPKPIIGRIHGRCVGGGVGLAAGVDYAIAVEGADIRLSELALGIGPFVVGPAIERKIGTAAFSYLALDTLWRNADWARRKGLYAEMHSSVTAMDEAIQRLSDTLSHANPQALAELKKILWKGTENWDQLLFDRAAISGRLILSQQAKDAIQKARKK